MNMTSHLLDALSITQEVNNIMQFNTQSTDWIKPYSAHTQPMNLYESNFKKNFNNNNLYPY